MLRLKLLFFGIIFFFGSTCFAQGWNPVGARSNSLSNASVALEDIWAYHHNPGALSQVKTLTVGAFYETRFLTKELQTQGVVVASPLKKGVISFGGQLFGYEQYRNTRVGAGYCMQLAERFSAGIQGNVELLRLGSNYGNTVNATFEAGIMAKISEQWKMGMSVLNIGRQRIAGLTDHYATTMRLGAIFQPSAKLNILFEVEKQVISPVSFKSAIEYLPTEQFFLRVGAQSGPTSFAFGFGYKKKAVSIDFGSRYHPVLGWSPVVGFNYQFAKKDAQ